MLSRLRKHRFAVHTVVLFLFGLSSWAMYFAAGDGRFTGILLGLTVLGAVLVLWV